MSAEHAANTSDPLHFAQNMVKVAEQSQRILQAFLSRQGKDGMGMPMDPMGITNAYMQMMAQLLKDPQKVYERQIALWKDYMQLWGHTTHKLLGKDTDEGPAGATRDKRFKDPAWQENAVFDFIKQSYLVTARWLQETVDEVDGLDPKTLRKLDFYTRQFVDAMAPSNFVMTNPEVLRATLESGGDNLVKGLNNLLEDLERGRGNLRISMTDYKAFEVGKNLAITPGKVVFRNDLMELLQYTPSTKEVYRTPVLFIPPWINKYYILDLQPDNSLVKWLVDQGHTVFVISWVNPDERLSQKHFEDYLTEGVLTALNMIAQATGEEAVNAVGYCLGGTLLAIAQAWLKAKGEEKRVASATYFTTMIDFAEAGELSVFIDEEQLSAMEARMAEKGFMEGSEMAMTFNMLRANDLIWSFVVNNYLLGKEPFPFDLLYWNSDSTRMPAVMHSYYLRNMYQQNRLIQPGGVTMAGVPIDIHAIRTPSYLLSTREDHIAPWKSTYAATQHYKGKTQFVLAASGHIAGVINPPVKKKYSFWTNDALPAQPDEWFKGAKEQSGSWWPHWQAWLAQYSGDKVAARKPGDGALKVLGDAPGEYVKVLV